MISDNSTSSDKSVYKFSVEQLKTLSKEEQKEKKEPKEETDPKSTEGTVQISAIGADDYIVSMTT